MSKLVYNPERNLLVPREAFNEAGRYSLTGRQWDAKWNAQIQYTPADDDAAPVAVVMPGYYGDAIEGANNQRIANILQGHGFAVAQLNFGGISRDETKLEGQDHVTLDTNIADLADVIEAAGESRVVLVANSHSINPTFKGGKFPENVSHILAIAPFPDMGLAAGMLLRHPAYAEQAAQYAAGGYFHFVTGENERVVFTKGLIESSGKKSIGQGDMSVFTHKPNVRIIRTQDDRVVSVAGPLLNAWIANMKRGGFEVVDVVLPGNQHGINDDIAKALEKQVKAIAPSSDNEPTRPHPAPVPNAPMAAA